MERPLALVRQAVVVLIAALLVASPTAAQEQVRSAKPADAGSLNAIITAVHDVISCPVGEARDQLCNDGERWWIVTIFWDSERPDNPIPAKYVSGGVR